MPTMTAKPDRSLMVRALAHSMMEDALSDFALLGRRMPKSLEGIAQAIPLAQLGDRFEETTLQGNTPQWSIGHGGAEGEAFRTEALELFEKMLADPADAVLERLDFATKAGQILDSFRMDPDARDFTSQRERNTVVKVFRSNIEAALPLDRVIAIASAIDGSKFERTRTLNALSVLVRSKILRRRTIDSVSHWEVNVED